MKTLFGSNAAGAGAGAGADLDYMNDRKVFTGLAKMTALQRAEDIGAKKIRDFLKSKGAKKEMKEKPLSGV